jgi:hypothetical protein
LNFTRELTGGLRREGHRCVDVRTTGHFNTGALTELRSNSENNSRYASISFRNPLSNDLFSAGNRKYFQGSGVEVLILAKRQGAKPRECIANDLLLKNGLVTPFAFCFASLFFPDLYTVNSIMLAIPPPFF